MALTLRLAILVLSALFSSSKSTEIDVNGIAIGNFQAASGSLDDVEVLIQEEAQVVNTLIELDKQLDEALNQLSSTSGALEVDVVVGRLGGSTSGSKFWVANEIIVEIPDSRLSEEKKDEIKAEIESAVAGTLDAMIIDEVVTPPKVEREGGEAFNDKIERFFEEEAEAEKELDEMKQELDKALSKLPNEGSLAEIDIVVTQTDGENEVVEDEIIVIIPASTGSGPRLTEDKKEELEGEIAMEAADALGRIILDEFMDDQVPQTTEVAGVQLPDAPERASVPFAEKAIQAAWYAQSEEKPALRGAATTTHTGFEHPMFVPHHWQRYNDQLWTMKLSMLASMSCLTLLLIVGVWTGVRRSRRHVLDDSHFRWAEAVEYMDAFHYDQ
ncbi:hypothetical protein F441_10870 [Phytophthora nicotianae CJ01A1]|uniref:Uncharacterized protein n=4 Tax=Phytophthora nicotianae TaxID=4792 RepID=W2Z5K5_PHYNI|nr:hypothetical protein L915_10691 [Phytophthora nicotianae]ETO73002.1 hypothetical protein F444_11016 [Phytophthora nicotianae P1976]ETP14164.1 hypothetical protein F441_10870 [Phytophthora nicotianae CJ01A1]ETP42221.1 hypothetical protein F442_10851 [Phytophthora nicotianae P10297]ETL37774.1 hypothetical protein L916_10582 [Phytophthora nicotianae]